MSQYKAVLIFLVSVLLVSCGNVNKATNEALKAASIQRMSGTWESSCFAANGYYKISTAIFSNNRFESRNRFFRDANCQTWIYSDDSLGEFVEHSLDANSSISKIDVTGTLPKVVNLPETGSFPAERITTTEIKTIFSIAKITSKAEGDILYFGTYSDGFDGSTPEKRHTLLSDTPYYRK